VQHSGTGNDKTMAITKQHKGHDKHHKEGHKHHDD
jgi:hypothetical protein